MYGKTNSFGSLEREVQHLYQGIQISSKSALKLIIILGKVLLFFLRSFMKAFLAPPRLIQQVGPHKFREIERVNGETHFELYRGPPGKFF